MNKLLVILLLALVGGFQVQASNPARDSLCNHSSLLIPHSSLRPVVSAFTLGVGTDHLCNTYLTPIHYSGWRTELGYERLQAMKFNPEQWIMRLDLRFWLGRDHNPAHTASIVQMGFRPSWSMLWRHRVGDGFTLAVGPNIGAEIGGLYLSRNGNNPASVQASVNVGATAHAAWNGRILGLPLTLRYQPTMPLMGAFFMPDYDELYYEIWLGNHSKLAHFGWPGNFFRLDNLLTADLHFGNTNLRLGYRCEIFSSKANNIVARDISHIFVIGLTTEWISLRPGSKSISEAKIISALY